LRDDATLPEADAAIAWRHHSPWINSCLCQEARRIDSSLRQQVVKTGIFRFESGLLEAFIRDVPYRSDHD
jgi:hypothetical protein